MCLTVNQAKTSKLLKKSKEFVVRHKTLACSGSTYYSPIFSEFMWQEGWNQAQGPCDSGRDQDGSQIIEVGAIHVFVRQDDAQKFYPEMFLCAVPTRCVIPVKCYLRDLIAVGKDDAGYETEAYRRVFVETLSEATNIIS